VTTTQPIQPIQHIPTTSLPHIALPSKSKHTSSSQSPSKGVISSDKDLLDDKNGPDATSSLAITTQLNKDPTSHEDN
jgi:hypothetical protein